MEPIDFDVITFCQVRGLIRYTTNNPCHVKPCQVITWHFKSLHVMSLNVLTCHVMSCHVMSSCHVKSLYVLLLCHDMSTHATGSFFSTETSTQMLNSWTTCQIKFFNTLSEKMIMTVFCLRISAFLLKLFGNGDFEKLRQENGNLIVNFDIQNFLKILKNFLKKV
jgi:hypothetical protein